MKQGWSIPFTPYRAVRGDDIDQLIERMRINVPNSIRESERTVAERDQILADAREEAFSIVTEAKLQARQMLSERALLDAANRERDRIVKDGQAEAYRRVDEANRYAVGALHELRDHLKTLTQQVDNGISEIEAHLVKDSSTDRKVSAKGKKGK